MESKKDFVKLLSKDIAKHGVKFFFVMATIFILFVGFNLLFLFLANIDHTLREGLEYKIVLLELLVGIIFCLVAIIMTKKYMLIKAISFGYKYLSPFFQNLCISLFENVYDKGITISKKDKVSQFINIGLIWKESYDTKMPSIVQKGLGLILYCLPFADLIDKVNTELSIRKQENNETNKTAVTNMLYEEVDSYIKYSILATNHFYNILILFVLNVFIQFGLAYFLGR